VTIRTITPASGQQTLTVTQPDDPYETQVTFAAGQVLDVEPGSDWESAIGLSNLSTLAGTTLAADQDGATSDGTENG
jgi:hypothetical protein